MVPDDRPAAKRSRIGLLEPTDLHTATLATQNRVFTPTPAPYLPIELITTILKLRFPRESRCKRDMARIYGLRLVSNAWKALIEDTPWFWAVISSDWPITVIQDCLRLSKNHLLRIKVPSDWSGTTKYLINKLQLLQLHAERWGALDYTGEVLDSVNPHARNILESHAPNLQSLCARLLKNWSSPTPILNLAGGKADQLKHLKLDNVLLPWSSQLLTGLETFSLRTEVPVPVEEIVTIFINSPCLRSFDLSYRDAGGQDIPTLPTSATSNSFNVTANSPEEVGLRFNNPRIANHILSRVSMPACTSLSLVVSSADMMNNAHSLDGAFSQFSQKIGNVMSQVMRTKLYIWPKRPSKWSISESEEEDFRFSLQFPVLSLEGFIECARNMASTLAWPLELEVYLETNRMPRWIGDMLGDWGEIIKLHVGSSPPDDEEDEEVLFPDYLGQPKIHYFSGLSWPFPKLQELDLSELEWPLVKVFDLLNRRYLPSLDVESLKDVDVPVKSPPQLDIRVHNELDCDDETINRALKSHRGVNGLHYGGLEWEEVEN